MNPNRYVLGLYLDSVEGTSIKKQMVLNVNVTETVAGVKDRTHTLRSKIATGPNYNFAETFFIFLEYAHKVKVRVCIYSNLHLINISSRFPLICVIQMVYTSQQHFFLKKIFIVSSK